MPTLSRWLIKAGLLHLLAALLLGLLMHLPSSLPWPGLVIWPAYIHLLVVGWLTQLILGVAFWMFPRARGERPRGREAPGWAAFWALNAGLVLRLVVEPQTMASPVSPLGPLLVVSAGLQLAAGLTFFGMLWPRIRAG